MRNEVILQQIVGNMALSGFELTEEDKDRILYLLAHPDEQDAILQSIINKHRKEEPHEKI